MKKYREVGEMTMKDEYKQIGWSVFDSSSIYEVTTTAFSISDGIISISHWLANEDGSEYKASCYRDINNSFTTC